MVRGNSVRPRRIGGESRSTLTARPASTKNGGDGSTPPGLDAEPPLKRRKRPIENYLVYLAVRAVVGVAQALSVEQSYAFARLLARVLRKVDRRHRLIGVDNLKQAFGDRYTEGEREAIVARVYEHFCMMLMEILHIPRKLHPTTWRDRITLVGHERVLSRLLDGGPLIIDRKSTRLNSSHSGESRMPSSA